VFVQQTGDPVAAQQLAWQQGSSFAYFDVFLMLTVVTLRLVPVVFLMKRPVARKGATSPANEPLGSDGTARRTFVSSVLRVQ
jgi:hypothetical protein